MPGPFETQDNNPDAWVGVREGLHRDTGEVISEFIIEGKDPQHHIHLGINEAGQEVFRGER